MALLSASGSHYGHPSRDTIQALFPYSEDWPVHAMQLGYSDNSYHYPTFTTTEAVFSASISCSLLLSGSGAGWSVLRPLQ